MKKILLGLGSLSLALGPIAGVLSCSEDEDKDGDLSKVFVDGKKVNADELNKAMKENKNVFIYLSENEPLFNYKEFLSSGLEDVVEKERKEKFIKNVIKNINEHKDDHSYKIVKVDSKETDNKGKIVEEEIKKMKKDWSKIEKNGKKLPVILLNKKEYVILFH